MFLAGRLITGNWDDRGLHSSGADGQRPRDAVVVPVDCSKILWSLRLNGDPQWDEICRLAASLRAGTVIPSAILRTLQRGPNPSSLARALAELGRVIKTLHVLEYVHDPAYRRTIHRLLSRGERRNALARDVFHGQRGQLRKHYQ